MQFKKHTSKKVLSMVLALALVILSGCGQSKTDEQTQALEIKQGEVASANKVFIVKPGTYHVHPGKYSISYKFYNADRTETDTSDMALEVKYGMPSMPQMKITPAKVTRLEDGRFDVEYFFNHEGAWQVTLGLKQNGDAIDTAVIDFDIDHEEEEHEEGEDHDHDGEDHDHDGDDHDHDHE